MATSPKEPPAMRYPSPWPGCKSIVAPPHREITFCWTKGKMKTTFFQIVEPDTTVRLVGVRCTFRDAVELEQALREKCGENRHITLIGRFDRVEMAKDMAEFLDSSLGTVASCQEILDKFVPKRRRTRRRRDDIRAGKDDMTTLSK